ncbi:hypothetical protein [Desulfocicer niacini]
MKPTRKSTKKEILAAVVSMAFTTYIITMIVLQEFFSIEYAEKLNGFLLQWIVNLAMYPGIVIIAAGIIAVLVAPVRRRR